MLVLVVLIDLQKLLVHDLLGRHEVLPLVIIELNEQRVEILSFEIDGQCVPLAMRTVVVEEFGLVRIISLGLCHHHAHYTCANWTLQKPLAFEFLRLGFSDLQLIITKLAIEALDVFL